MNHKFIVNKDSIGDPFETTRARCPHCGIQLFIYKTRCSGRFEKAGRVARKVIYECKHCDFLMRFEESLARSGFEWGGTSNLVPLRVKRTYRTKD
jgi:RNase P subunit RPR2